MTISRITLKDHAIDDGTVLPDDGGEGDDDANFDITGETNLWRKATIESMSYYYAPGWSQIADPGFTSNNFVYVVTLPESTSDQWQAQVFLVPTSEIALSASKKYDFSCKLESSKDLGKATVKLHKLNADGSADDNTSLVMETPALQAYTEKTINLKNIDGIDAPNIRLVLDFGGNAADTEISISGISLKEK